MNDRTRGIPTAQVADDASVSGEYTGLPSLVEAVQRRGVRVTVVSTISSQPPMIADELRRQADVFTDLVELKSKIGRDPSERPAPREPSNHAPQSLQRAITVAPRGDDDDFDDR
jgi:hypothetical protein